MRVFFGEKKFANKLEKSQKKIENTLAIYWKFYHFQYVKNIAMVFFQMGKNVFFPWLTDF